MTLLNSVYHSIRSSEVDMLCFRSVMLVRSFTANKISGTCHQPHLHAIRNIFVFVLVLPPIEMICKMCCLHRTFIHQSFWNTRCGRPRGRKLHLTRSLVALEGWSSVRDRTNTVRHTKYGRIRGMVVGEGGRSAGVLLFRLYHVLPPAESRLLEWHLTQFTI